MIVWLVDTPLSWLSETFLAISTLRRRERRPRALRRVPFAEREGGRV
jgi:hypothetical protein